MVFLLFIVPILVFIISSTILYILSNNPEKKKTNTILIRNIMPGIVIGLFVFIVIRYKDAQLFNSEPLMHGDYFS
jgi:hypothetical protein